MVQYLKLLFLASVKGHVQDFYVAGGQFLCPRMDSFPDILVKIPVIIGRAGKYSGNFVCLMGRRRFGIVVHGIGQRQDFLTLLRTDSFFVVKCFVDSCNCHIGCICNIL